MRFVDFDWKESEGGGHVDCGIVAQEVEQLSGGSQLVFQPKDPSTGELGVRHVVPINFMTVSAKAIQELITKVETLEAKVATLEAG